MNEYIITAEVKLIVSADDESSAKDVKMNLNHHQDG